MVELPDSLRGVLARNIETVMQNVPALDSQPKIAAKAKIGQTTVGRALRAERPVNLDNVEALAKAMNLAPWQLLVPGVDPLRRPVLGDGIAEDEAELLRHYRDAEDVWKLTVRLIASATPNLQPELSHDVNMLMARLVGKPVKPISDAAMRERLKKSPEGFPPRTPRAAVRPPAKGAK